MPLSTVDVDREPIHTRAIECRSFRRSDGLWDIEGHLTDVKAYPFSNEFRGEIKPGEPLHDMWIRLTVDGNSSYNRLRSTPTRDRTRCVPRSCQTFRNSLG